MMQLPLTSYAMLAEAKLFLPMANLSRSMHLGSVPVEHDQPFLMV